MDTVFLSSTFIDLQPERLAVRDAALRLRHHFSGMEYFGSDPERPTDVSLSLVDEATVYVLLIAHRYGSLDSTTGKSITQLEWERARNRGIPTLAYIKDSATPVEPSSRYIDFDDAQREKLAKFKKQVLEECVVQYFTTPDNLAARVTADLARVARNEAAEPSEVDCHISLGIWPTHPSDESRILITGAPNVGKTVYGSVLTHEPAAVLSNKGIALNVDSGSSSLLDQWKLLQENEWAYKTDYANYNSAGFTIRQSSSNRSFKFNIADVSGEWWSGAFDPDMHDGLHGRNGFVEHMRSCDSLAVLLDVREGALPWSVDIDLQYANVITQLAAMVGGRKFKKPIAFVLTKCDLVPELLVDSQKAVAYMRDNYPQTHYRLCSHPRCVRVFATSAVGKTGQDGRPEQIRPHGVWDPINWIMHELNAFDLQCSALMLPSEETMTQNG